ncbi:MAG: DUF1579 family protein [Planctomycetota bacterium]|jgi:hypothetical protein
MQKNLPLALSLLALCISTPDTNAQEDPTGPAKEQARFHKLIGHWQGTGEFRLAPGAPASEWTTVSTARSILGGHFVQEDVSIDFGEYAPNPFILRNYYGYDKESKKWMMHSFDNMGGSTVSEVLWEDDKMLMGKSTTELGQLLIEHSVRTLEDDSYTLEIRRAVGSGESFVHSFGMFERQEVADASFSKDMPAFMPPAEQMSKLNNWVGSFRMEGWMIMSPDMPKMDIKATETMGMIFGGTALEIELVGDPIPGVGGYEGRGVILWSALDQCYKNIVIDSSGKATMMNGNWVGDDFVVGIGKTEGRIPMAAQTTVKCDADGTPKSVTEYRIAGSGAPLHSFQGTYVEKKE